MKLELFWSDKLQVWHHLKFAKFAQQLINRLMQGHVRYGGPAKRQCYMSRLEMEVKRYRKTGNYEQLLNIANYAYLESLFPENPKFHFDDKVESVTRDRFGI